MTSVSALYTPASRCPPTRPGAPVAAAGMLCGQFPGVFCALHLCGVATPGNAYRSGCARHVAARGMRGSHAATFPPPIAGTEAG